MTDHQARLIALAIVAVSLSIAGGTGHDLRSIALFLYVFTLICFAVSYIESARRDKR